MSKVDEYENADIRLRLVKLQNANILGFVAWRPTQHIDPEHWHKHNEMIEFVPLNEESPTVLPAIAL
jgi:hypothetical protein